MSDFDRTNTLLPFDETRYRDALANRAQLDGLITANDLLIESGLIDTGTAGTLIKLKKNLDNVIRLLKQQKPVVE